MDAAKFQHGIKLFNAGSFFEAHEVLEDVWRANKRLISWTRETSAAAPMPDKLARMMRQSFIASRANFFISFPMLFFMGASSHYPLFGR